MIAIINSIIILILYIKKGNNKQYAKNPSNKTHKDVSLLNYKRVRRADEGFKENERFKALSISYLKIYHKLKLTYKQKDICIRFTVVLL